MKSGCCRKAGEFNTRMGEASRMCIRPCADCSKKMRPFGERGESQTDVAFLPPAAPSAGPPHQRCRGVVGLAEEGCARSIRSRFIVGAEISGFDPYLGCDENQYFKHQQTRSIFLFSTLQTWICVRPCPASLFEIPAT